MCLDRCWLLVVCCLCCVVCRSVGVRRCLLLVVVLFCGCLLGVACCLWFRVAVSVACCLWLAICSLLCVVVVLVVCCLLVVACGCCRCYFGLGGKGGGWVVCGCVCDRVSVGVGVVVGVVCCCCWWWWCS